MFNDINYRKLEMIDAERLVEIDRSETIELIYEMQNGVIAEIKAGHECPNWDVNQVNEMKERFKYELRNGGKAFGAFDEGLLVGFAVLGHKFRGKDKKQLQVDLMYVSRAYRRKGIGTRLMEQLSFEAKSLGADYLYISSTETQSAVGFYRSAGSHITEEVDEELFELEPKDIHMLKKL